ncbi:uncharacterized protein RCO7_14412 [Rhynchosporium graminicola]|uniref:Uncharacterized protein n=1 Tax=Rhynchosporium graminicola TaxID=2792576 RepID=A0A1E1KE73_9HELO|nr:uncharacterized protein RCO7_14412 [Rhynchosporium commune]
MDWDGDGNAQPHSTRGDPFLTSPDGLNPIELSDNALLYSVILQLIVYSSAKRDETR